MTWQQGGDGIFIAGMIAIAIIVAYACACRWALRYLRGVNARQQCERCAIGSFGLPCACTTDCGAPNCLGWLDDLQRDVMRGGA